MAELKNFEIIVEFEMHIDDVQNGWLNHTKLNEWVREGSESNEADVVAWMAANGFDYKMQFTYATSDYLTFELTYSDEADEGEYYDIPDEFEEFADEWYYFND